MAIIHLNFYSDALKSQEMLSIALPQDSKLPDGKKLPVLYLLHGYTGNHNSWLNDVHVERYATQMGGHGGFLTDEHFAKIMHHLFPGKED